MKIKLGKSTLAIATILAVGLVGCSKSDSPETLPPVNEEGYITLAGALYQTNPGDGNGGTKVFSITAEEARNPNFTVDVFDKGFGVKSNRTARLQASIDGQYLYNIQYTGDDGGVFNKYEVKGGSSFTEVGSALNTSTYVGTSPRWVKAAEGIGVAVDVKVAITKKGTAPFETINTIKSSGRVLVLDLHNTKLINVNENYFDMPALSDDEIAKGYHVFRFDAPVLNKKGDKLYIGTWMRQYDMNGYITYNSSNAAVYPAGTLPRLATRTLVVDYPSLTNPHFITSTQATGDNSGYRSPMNYVAEDGAIYQATHRELEGTGGSKILKIGADNKYDNSFVLSLDQALGTKDSYIESWRYVGDGIGYVLYSLNGEGGYVARVDLKNRTAIKQTITDEATLDFGQHQGIGLKGDYVYIPVTGIGADGNIHVFNRKTGEMTLGAKLKNKAGNRYIGAY
ncbi:hypothetical protein SAMN05660841_03864 [Sphingobacterium nematocida]|uniref:DUF4374 domain-containing protein n=1 Tax=Sphingobacterium nematocida TaxID=1513896 RepID=A0A1T5G8I2_9SPHI|nr:hypothetical protein [Sphingobacterium nematocida]SKC04697.1 hypothetical protein SAMN05660841_03864 [Sphingobacterium nematocida]